MTAQEWSLGVDAGATRSRARLRDAEGAVRAEAEGPAANAYVDFLAAVAAVAALIAATLRRGGAPERAHVRAGFGVAGVSDAAEAARFAAAFEGFAKVAVVNDAVAACWGAHGGADGGLVVVGTGSAAVARVAGRDILVGGRGLVLGDDGSAARLGLDSARAAMRAADGLGPASDFTRAVMARFGDPLAMLAQAARATPRDWGALAPLALEAATAGDPVAAPLAAAAAQAAAALVTRVEALGAPRVAMVGGLAAPLRPFLDPAVAARLSAPLGDAVDGAIACVGAGAR